MNQSVKNSDILKLDLLYQQLNNETFRCFQPYDRQTYFTSGTAKFPVNYMSACNGAGKTAIGAAIDTAIITGEYPDWYKGFRLEQKMDIWIGSTSPDLLQAGIQDKLFCSGGYDVIDQALRDDKIEWTGMIPKRLIKRVTREQNTNYVKSATIRNTELGEISVRFFHYGLQAKRLAGKHPVGWIHCDEIPPVEIWNELIARQRTSPYGIRGIITATPELDADQEMIDRLFSEQWEKDGNGIIIVPIDDVPDHIISHDNKEQAKRETSPALAKAKLYGEPLGGARLLHRVDPTEMRISVTTFEKIKSERRLAAINGLDFGFNDAMAFVEMMVDMSNGDVYLVRGTKKTEMNAVEFCNSLRSSGVDFRVPVAWPHDGMRHDKREDKKPFIQSFADQHLNVMSAHAPKPVRESNKIAVWADIETKGVEKKFFIVDGNFEIEQEWRKLRVNRHGKVVGEDHLMDAMACAWNQRQYCRLIVPRESEMIKTFYQDAMNSGVRPDLLI